MKCLFLPTCLSGKAISCEDFLLKRDHDSFIFWLNVVVAVKMQEAMDDCVTQLALKAVPIILGMAANGQWINERSPMFLAYAR